MGKKVLVDGNEVELPDEAVEEIQGEAVKKYQEENPDKSSDYEEKLKASEEEKAELKRKIEEAETEEVDEDDTAKNLANLRKKLDAKDKAITDLEEKVTSTDTFVRSSAVEKSIKKFAGDDDELAKKVKHHFENTLSAVSANNEQEIMAKAEQAATLSGWKPEDNVLKGSSVATSGSTTPKASEMSAEDMAMAEKLGLTAEDFKKKGDK